MVKALISTFLADPIGILLSGVFVGFMAKIFHRSFLMGFIAGFLPKIVLPFIYPFASIIPLLLMSTITLTLLYFLFIWVLCRFTPKQSLGIAIVAVVTLEFGVVYFKQLLPFEVK